MKNKISHVLPTMLLWPFIYILAFSSILNAQDCVYKITPPSTSDHTAIVFEIISPGDGELINNIVISGKISPPPPRQGSGDESLYALRLNGDVWYLIAGRSTSQFEDFGGTTYEISLNEIYETSPPEYSFDITIIQGVAASFPQNWELHIDKLKPTEQYTIQADFTSNATIAGDFFNVIRCPQPDISITDVYNTSIGPLNFPETTVGELRDSIIRLHNGTGPNVADLVISSYSISPSDNFSTSISGSVVPGGAVDFTVSFIPDEGLPPGNVATEVLTIDLYGIPAIPAEILDLNGVAVKHDFMICLDISGSMDLDAAGNWEVPVPNTRLQKAKDALGLFFSSFGGMFGNRGRIGFVVFPDPLVSCPSANVPSASGISNIQTSQIEAIKLPHLNPKDHPTDPGLVANGSTSLAAGLELSRQQFTTPPNTIENDFVKKYIYLLTDGKHNCDSPPPRIIPADFYTYLNDDEIKVYTVGLGTPATTSSAHHVELSGLAVATGGRFWDVDVNLGINLSKVLTDALTASLNLESLVDPITAIERRETKKHGVQIAKAKSTVAFLLSWETYQQNLLSFKLLSPDCKVINPAVARSNSMIKYASGPTYKAYYINWEYFSDPRKLGEWNLVVKSASAETESYFYNVISRSGLTMKPRFDIREYLTGSKIFAEIKLQDDGLPVTGVLVSADIKRPLNAVNNFLGTNSVQQSQLDSIPRKVSGDLFSRGIQKLTALRNFEKRIFTPKHESTSLLFYDDGSHGDKKANDGIYTNSFDKTTIPGSYSFSIDAVGRISGRRIFTRNVTSDFYFDVNFNPDSKISSMMFTPIDTIDGLVQTRFSIIPKDKFGNFLGLDREDDIDFTIKEGTGILLSDTTGFDPNGGYSTIVQYNPGTQYPVVSISFQGETVTTTINDDEGVPWWIWILILIIVIIIIILLIKRQKK